jgi:hypothetical protein
LSAGCAAAGRGAATLTKMIISGAMAEAMAPCSRGESGSADSLTGCGGWLRFDIKPPETEVVCESKPTLCV